MENKSQMTYEIYLTIQEEFIIYLFDSLENFILLKHPFIQEQLNDWDERINL